MAQVAGESYIQAKGGKLKAGGYGNRPAYRRPPANDPYPQWRVTGLNACAIPRAGCQSTSTRPCTSLFQVMLIISDVLCAHKPLFCYGLPAVAAGLPVSVASDQTWRKVSRMGRPWRLCEL